MIHHPINAYSMKSQTRFSHLVDNESDPFGWSHTHTLFDGS